MTFKKVAGTDSIRKTREPLLRNLENYNVIVYFIALKQIYNNIPTTIVYILCMCNVSQS